MRAIPCDERFEICSVCGLCIKHCIEHVNMRQPIPKLNSRGEKVFNLEDKCKTLLNWQSDGYGGKTLMPVGRSDIPLIREVEDPKKRKKAKRAA